ncbi:amidohydrolase family protein [Actinokineospora xionganensis]|uniref:Amidohydrolase family protein n=1 Tax=Actinokineospora xionganensis TaxID=2684470 RepID=A0ABR7KZ15_9PSEU|nr:amidohydrolase family protein [Actinokineospora xionganensis]MBC6445666.1 amidohydrolase family protein [Actinokineospora xionganensis]
MTVDAHHHLWDPAGRDYPWMSSPDLDPIRRVYTVDDLARVVSGTSVLVQTVSSVEETAEFLAVARGSGGLIAGVVGWVDLEGDLVLPSDDLLVGVRHQLEDEPDPAWLLRPSVMASLRALGLPYDLLVRGPQRAAALAGVRELGEVSFVLDHAGKPEIAAGEWEPWASWISAMAACPNVVCKLSGLTTQASWDGWTVEQVLPYAAHVLAAFGMDRVMFGSDWPVCDLAGGYSGALSVAEAALVGCGADERAAVLGGTARRVYGLSG